MFKTRGTIICFAVILLSIIFLGLFAGCAARPKVYEEVGSTDMAYSGKAVPAAAPAPAAPPAAYNDARMAEAGIVATAESGSAYAAEQGRRHIIQNAYLYLEIRDIEESVAALQNLADQAGGYVASREIFNLGEERRAGHVSLRVPADRFALVLTAIKELGKSKNERVYTDDVTMQYIDLEARIANLAAQEKRLRELLERAESIEDIMQVERELGRIRGDLEAMEGNFRYLRERVQYSSIDIQLEEKDPRTLMVVDDKFSGFGERLANLLALNTNRFLQGLAGFFLVTIGSLPIVLPLLLFAFLVGKGAAALKRLKHKKRDQQQDLAQ